MKLEFITTHGKLVIERDKIFLIPQLAGGNYYLNNLFILLVCIITAYEVGPDKTSFLGIIAFISLIELYPFIKRSFTESTSNRILLNEIKNITIEPPKNEYETLVKLHLNSAKPRIIKFRTLENQYQPFIETVSKHIQKTHMVVL
jgi:hypothetical protein